MSPLRAEDHFSPARGTFEAGYESVVRCFARQLEAGEQTGASFAVYRRGVCVVDIWGGLADVASKRPWEEDTRIVLFSVTKGFAAMAFHLLADRGQLDWDAPVSDYWPGFGRAGKEGMSVGTLLGHRGGLAAIDTKLTLDDCVDPGQAAKVLEAIESQRPEWEPGSDQAYHAITFGLYARELFERIAGEDMGAFLRRELFEPLGSDVYLGTPPSEDARFATLYPPKVPTRVGSMLTTAITQPESAEARVFRAFLNPRSITHRSFVNPSSPRNDLTLYNKVPVRRSTLAWASATGTARGVARAYLPFASRGEHDGRRYLKAETISPVYGRLGWSERDKALQKPMGWSNGFLKEERHIFCPNPESFGHPGMGGSLGWADPVEELTIGYAMNRMDWRVRSKRAMALCHALYDSEALCAPRLR